LTFSNISALEDGFILQKSLESTKSLEEGLIEFENNRLSDANALRYYLIGFSIVLFEQYEE
jgi:hypothetical protein